ncbi:diacylglycerol O-acyltransferase 2B [Raphidocelis subcapitata]|uniref:Acyltransferase n=1 Tax=Raphidocelis subcapitata TaxID=307507 RepID=A0A2V0P709_9CHLO|nr:diacylglycerol O-acyltransferase 2B [Raphidocelis subcapitata]|eukprot:GBF94712.1 diacylglycerol O-acyltransferase 2B [Raphidocelis subcapitata]
MAAKAAAKAAAGAKRPAEARLPPPRSPSWRQKAVVAIYIYFIPVLVAANLAMLLTRWTAVLWLLYTLYINVGPARLASKDGSWPKLLRRAKFWRHFADYFPVRLHKTGDLDPGARYVFVVHPHGIVSTFCWPVFDTNATGFAEKFPGIDVHPMTLGVNFRLPLVREFLLAVGVADASEEACLRLLGRGPGSSIMLAVGGAQESLHCEPGTMDLVLKRRKGFARIALTTGARLVPVIGFGENELFDILPTPPGSFRARVQALLKSTAGFVLPNAVGTSLVFGKTGWMPHARPLDVVVGAPLEFDIGRLLKGAPDSEMPMEKLVDAFHEQYCEALQKLYDDHKEKFHKGRAREMRLVE